MAGLPPAARLRHAADFAALRHGARRIDGQHLGLRCVSSPTGQARVGLAVSRKVSKRAVARNRIKRLVRESFRQQRSILPAWDVLVIARTSAATASNADLRADLAGCWSRLAALKPGLAPGTIGG